MWRESGWFPGLVDKTSGGGEKTVHVACGFGPDGPQPPARGECLKEFVSGVGGIGHNLSSTLQSPGGVKVLERRQIAANHLLC